ncbi:hypothetical protein GF314_10325 [bacterium]|nr:hypothetical protein [bacterium]
MRRTLPMLILLFLVRAALAADLAPIALHDGWPVRDLPADPPEEVTLATEVVWTLDCGDQAETLVGRLRHAAAGHDGRLFLADTQMGHVLQISPEGEVEAARGREGEGPGEFKGLYRVMQLPDGRLGAVGGAPAPTFVIGLRGELVFIDADDDPASHWLVGGDPGSVPTTAVRDLRQAGGRLLVVTDRTQVSPPEMTQVRELSLLEAPDGARTVIARQLWTTAMDDVAFHERDQFSALAYGRCDLAADGRVAVAPERDRWLVAVGEPGGTGVVWHRPIAGPVRSDDQREAAREEQGVADLTQICERDPVIGRVRWRPDGRLWVEPRGVAPRPGCVACFDEITADGHLARRVHLAVDGAPEHGRLQLLPDGRMVWFEGFEWRDDAFEGAPRVRLLRLAAPDDARS